MQDLHPGTLDEPHFQQSAFQFQAGNAAGLTAWTEAETGDHATEPAPLIAQRTVARGVVMRDVGDG